MLITHCSPHPVARLTVYLQPYLLTNKATLNRMTRFGYLDHLPTTLTALSSWESQQIRAFSIPPVAEPLLRGTTPLGLW